MKAREILSFWKAQHLELGPREGFRLGSPDIELSGVLVCWLPTLGAIEEAKRRAYNLIIARDQFVFPPDYSGALLDHQLSDRVTQPRVRAAIQAGITVFRAYASLDGLLEVALAGELGLPEPAASTNSLQRLYEIDPVTVGELALRAGAKLNQRVMRICGDQAQIVHRIALLVGNRCDAHNPDGLLPVLESHPDVLIVGETDEYPMRAALDLGIPLIEIGHERSIAPGLRGFAALLAGQFPGLAVTYFENPRPWVLV